MKQMEKERKGFARHIRTGAAVLAAAMMFAVPAAAAETEKMPAEGSSCPQMSFEEYPRVDGSLACVPLLEALAVEATGCTPEEAEETLNDFTNTNPCYLQLAEGNRDLLLVYEPADSTKEELEKYDPLEMTPVGRDALVFMVNENNPLESITKEQLIGIYTGEITNWSQVGGADEEIKVFARPETSGSQTMMRKLLLGDRGMVEGQFERIETMEDMVMVIQKYDNSSNALGYSVYYYASEMMGEPGLRFLSVEGVAPSNETIADGSYPLINDFYCVTNGQSSENALLLRDWLVTDEGQIFVQNNGYVPVRPVE